ncbi:GNAT family N-acetyltransferase [Pseudalkalibacillus sp. SCS-8]|uniref:GNAT family N-acetyltransferase n=1 Tax=Pseudalkalibacillus nanhaiensis TaxID=3115291 RepID=UPI0032DBCF8C
MTLKREPHIYTFEAKDGTDVTIRPADIRDAEQIISAAESIVSTRSFIQKEETRSLEEEKAFITDMKLSNNMYSVVEAEGKIVGIARVMRGELEMKRHCGVFRTWVTEDAQGKGIGTKIMAYTLDWGRKENLHKIWLTVFSNNPIASKLYERYGFVYEGTQKDQLCIKGEFEDEIYMAYFFDQRDRC